MQKQRIFKMVAGGVFVLLAIIKTYQLITESSGWSDQFLLLLFVVIAIVNFMTLEEDHD